MAATSNHVSIVTMGGTIDKDYPRLTSGYAFEFGDESAASRVLTAHPNLGFTYDVTSICKMDSLEVTDRERELLADAVREIIAKRSATAPRGLRIVVTHGTDTMIETAKYLQDRINGQGAVVAFTGATKPERFIDSDASFNLGSAISATSSCPPNSTVICMNGNVIAVEDCVRDETSGLFIRKTKSTQPEDHPPLS